MGIPCLNYLLAVFYACISLTAYQHFIREWKYSFTFISYPKSCKLSFNPLSFFKRLYFEGEKLDRNKPDCLKYLLYIPIYR